MNKKKKKERKSRTHQFTESVRLIQNRNSANVEACLYEIHGLRWQEHSDFSPVQQKFSSNYLFSFADKAFTLPASSLAQQEGVMSRFKLAFVSQN